jgi:hypothetical protein
VAAPEAATCHSFLAFSGHLWTNGKVPRGSPYNHVAWPSHGLPRGSGKMPNDSPRMKFSKKIKRLVGPPNLAGPHQIWHQPDLSRTTAKFSWQITYLYIYICIYYMCVLNEQPKGEARGLDPGTSPSIYALTHALPTTRPTTLVDYKAPFLFKN